MYNTTAGYYLKITYLCKLLFMENKTVKLP